MTIKLSSLNNGVRIVTDTYPSQTAAIGVWLRIGTRHEPLGKDGISHFCEHMIFKGTKTHTSFGIEAEIERRGGYINAYTETEETAVHAEVLPRNTIRTLRLLADILQNSTFHPHHIATEREVIFREKEKDADSPSDRIEFLLHEHAFPRQKFGRSILGSDKSLRKIRRSDLVKHLDHYCGQNIVVVGTGKVNHSDVCEEVDKLFGHLPRGKRPGVGVAKMKGGLIREASDELSSTTIKLAFPAPKLGDENLYAVHLLNQVVGNWTSRLFCKTRNRGLVYSIGSNYQGYSDTGLLTIKAATNPNMVRELASVVGKELCGIRRRITKAEFERAQALNEVDLAKEHNSPPDWAATLGNLTLAIGHPLSLEQMREGYRSVSLDDVQHLAQKIFSEPPAIAALGPQHNVPDYTTFLDDLDIKCRRVAVHKRNRTGVPTRQLSAA